MPKPEMTLADIAQTHARTLSAERFTGHHDDTSWPARVGPWLVLAGAVVVAVIVWRVML
jgi:hypothetical protein